MIDKVRLEIWTFILTDKDDKIFNSTKVKTARKIQTILNYIYFFLDD